MKKLILAAPALLLALAACTPTDQAMGTGAAAGAALGAIVSDDGDQAKGALLGAVVGAAAGGIAAGAAQGPQCRYRYSDGRTYVGPCPAN